MAVRTELRIGVIEAKGEDADDLEKNFNDELSLFFGGYPAGFAKVLGLDLQPVEELVGDRLYMLGVLKYEVSLKEPDPVPTEQEVTAQAEQETEYRMALGRILSIASGITRMREAGKRGDGLDYKRLWELIDSLGVEFRSLGGGVLYDAVDPPQEGDADYA